MNVNLCQGAQFLQGFHNADRGRFADAWEEIHNPQLPYSQGRGSLTHVPGIEHTIRPNNQLQPDFDGKMRPFLLLCQLLVQI